MQQEVLKINDKYSKIYEQILEQLTIALSETNRFIDRKGWTQKADHIIVQNLKTLAHAANLAQRGHKQIFSTTD